MQMPWQAGACNSPQIHADVKTFGPEQLAVNGCQPGEQGHAGHVFLAGHFFEASDVPEWRNEQVPVVVRISIQDDDGVSLSDRNEELPIRIGGRIEFGGSPAEKASFFGTLAPRARLGRRCVGSLTTRHVV